MSKKTSSYTPAPYFLGKFPPGKSGNDVNGLGETRVRKASPFFWHKPEIQEFGDLQQAVINHHRKAPEIAEAYSAGPHRGPPPVSKARQRKRYAPEEATLSVKQFVLDNEGDLVGIARMDPLWVYEGFEIKHPWVIMIGVAMDHARLDQAPASFKNPTAGVEVANKYNQAARVCRKLVNHILALGYEAKPTKGLLPPR